MKKARQLKISFSEYPDRKALPVHVVEEPAPKILACPKYEVSEVELSYKSKTKACDRPRISDSRSAYEILKNAWDDNKLDMVEQFDILLLNRAHAVLGIYRLSTGGISGTVADPRLAFTAALKANACEMILSHNHPSDNIKPSRADEDLTTKFKESGKMLDIKVLDHIIMTRDKYLSFADEGLI